MDLFKEMNVEHPTPNKNKYQIPNNQQLFLFLFSPSTPLRAVSLSNGRFDTRNENLIQFFCSLLNII